jgi:hypothetical protein
MKRNFFCVIGFVLVGILLFSCQSESADGILSDLDKQIGALEKVKETVTSNPEKVFVEMEKWQEKFMKTLKKKKKYQSSMTLEQKTRLNDIFNKGSAITEQIFN